MKYILNRESLMKLLLKTALICSILFFAWTAAVTVASPDKTPPKFSHEQEDAPPMSPPPSGKVIETMNSGGYTYVHLDKNGKKLWVAVPEMKVVVGREMTFQAGYEMHNFTSKSLNRTFDVILFSGGSADRPEMPSGHKTPVDKTSGSTAAASSADKTIKVRKAAGPEAYTIAEIFAKQTELNNKTVVVRAKVVKASAKIMGANWIHLQDGTGDANKKTHNLVVTTDGMPKVGDVITIKGVVSVDKDFGSGYKYDVIVEKAVIQP
jgi:hypothetical protein